MKLSKQERIGVLIIAVIILIVLGIIFLLVPKWEEVSASQNMLTAKQSEHKAALEKAALKEDLRTQVEDAYDQGRNLADMFFEEMDPYQADQETRAMLQQIKDNGANIVVDALSISEKAISPLSITFNEIPVIDYALKTYATQGVQPTEDEAKANARREKLINYLSGMQDVGSITVSFEVTAEDHENLLKFADGVNKYIKEENGKDTRKAVMLSGYALEYPLVVREYEKLMDEMQPEITKKAEEELVKKWADLADVSEDKNNNEDTANTEDENKDEKIGISDTIYTMDISITFYSIERMQDPAELLDQQDEAA